jgi:hypothetical protein
VTAEEYLSDIESIQSRSFNAFKIGAAGGGATLFSDGVLGTIGVLTGGVGLTYCWIEHRRARNMLEEYKENYDLSYENSRNRKFRLKNLPTNSCL